MTEALLSYRNQSIDLRTKSLDWFLYDNGLRHERVHTIFWNARSGEKMVKLELVKFRSTFSSHLFKISLQELPKFFDALWSGLRSTRRTICAFASSGIAERNLHSSIKANCIKSSEHYYPPCDDVNRKCKSYTYSIPH